MAIITTQVTPPTTPSTSHHGQGSCWASAYQPALGLDERPVDAIHLVVEATGVAQVVTRPIPPPQRGGHGPAVDTLPAFREVVKHIYWVGRRGERTGGLLLPPCCPPLTRWSGIDATTEGRRSPAARAGMGTSGFQSRSCPGLTAQRRPQPQGQPDR